MVPVHWPRSGPAAQPPVSSSSRRRWKTGAKTSSWCRAAGHIPHGSPSMHKTSASTDSVPWGRDATKPRVAPSRVGRDSNLVLTSDVPWHKVESYSGDILLCSVGGLGSPCKSGHMGPVLVSILCDGQAAMTVDAGLPGTSVYQLPRNSYL